MNISNISSEQPQAMPGGVLRVTTTNGTGLGQDLSRVSHNLMGSISALLMCEHMLSRELAASQEFAQNEMLQTTLELLKETAEQIREHGEDLKLVARRLDPSGSKKFPPSA